MSSDQPSCLSISTRWGTIHPVLDVDHAAKETQMKLASNMVVLLLAVGLFIPTARAGDQRPIVAVFNVEASETGLSGHYLNGLADYLATRLTESGAYQVVPRDQVKQRLVQQKKGSYKECYNQSCQIEIGKELAAEKTLAAKVIKLGNRCTVTLTLYDLRKSTTESAASQHGECGENSVIESVDKALDKLFGAKQAQPEALAEPAEESSPVPEGFVRIPPGSFQMGSPASEDGRDSGETQHRVTITRAFLMQATEVTQGQYRALMGKNPSHFASCGDDCPVEQVSWHDAVTYCNALSHKEGLPECYDGDRLKGLDCKGYRLPTEAEWEYAARAGSTGARYGELDAVAWYWSNSGKTTHTVGKKNPNAWGLYDMLGNVYEWCHDWKSGYPSGLATDPTGPRAGSIRVNRGGSWNSPARFVRAAFRSGYTPVSHLNSLFILFHGLRPARFCP